jgi:DNA repair protein RecN (Recombination protein N)
VLKRLHIRNFAIIDQLDLQFSGGLTVFTGETGAGKSILVDAMGLALGDRADASVIRPGSQQAEITAVFDIRDNSGTQSLLEQQALEDQEDEIIIRRVIAGDGRSRAFVNDRPVAAQLLRGLGELLVDIHSQHDHQSLGRREIQRELLDDYGGHGAASATVLRAYNDWIDARTRLQELEQADDRDATISLLRYQVAELETLRPVPGEYEAIDNEHRRLANSARLLDTAHRAYNRLHDDEQSINSELNSLQSELRDLEQFDPRLVDINRIMDEAGIHISEAANELRRYTDSLDIDPGSLQEVEKRLADYHAMARKHQVQPQQLADQLETLQERLNAHENNQQLIEDLQIKLAAAMQGYREAAVRLSQDRTRTAKKLQQQITRQLHSLGMPDGEFVINLESNDSEEPRPWGIDQVDYLVNMNPGQSLQPLRKVASGGELSRISLAIKVIASSDRGVPCLIFDEVDAGIGGGVAEIVGNLLHGLARQNQVLCVTHLAQVASQGDNHLQVKKSTDRSSTRTQILELTNKERIEEIARMLGGLTITEQTRKHAKEMLKISGKKT